MQRILFYAAGIFVLLHGLVHLIGLVAYWPLAELPDFPYKTTLLGDRWDVGAGGARAYSVLWLIAAVVMVAAVVGLFAGQAWWQPVMVSVSVLSIVLCVLAWSLAYRGAVISAVMLAVILVGPRIGLLAAAR